jgi:hypothetical protein
MAFLWRFATWNCMSCVSATSPSPRTPLSFVSTGASIEGGSYSGLSYVNKVGTECGQILADQTMRAMQALFTPAGK